MAGVFGLICLPRKMLKARKQERSTEGNEGDSEEKIYPEQSRTNLNKPEQVDFLWRPMRGGRPMESGGKPRALQSLAGEESLPHHV